MQRSSGRDDSASEYTSGFHSQLAAVEEEGDEVDDELLRSARSVLAAANIVQLKALSGDDNEVEDESKAEGNGIDKNNHNGVESPAA
jgi:hypothetical protein